MFSQRDVTDVIPKLPVDEVSKSFLEMVTGAQKLENAVQLVIGLGFDSAMKDADHDAVWMLSSGNTQHVCKGE